jgi:long-subunit acyl-CoA synthetase (AMP-forming)
MDRALQHRSLPAAFLDRAATSPDDVALRVFGSDEQLTLGQWAARSRAVAGGLRSLGVRPGDRVALLLSTRMEFHIADMGVLLAGAIPFSLYATSSVPQLQEIVDNAEPLVIVCETGLAEKAREIMKAGPPVEHLAMIEDDSAGDGELTLAELEARCPSDFDPVAATAHIGRDDLCTLVYTSGTTGPPKGVQFRHGAMLDCLDSIRQRFPTSEADRALSYLPMAHIAERIFGHYAAFVYGYEVTSLADLSELAAALQAVRPTRFFGVPRVYEKLLAGLHRHISASPDGDALRSALAARLERVRAEQRGTTLPPGDDAADLASLRPLAELTGLDQATFLVVAGAPSTLGVLEELTAIGLPINEFYGSSEVTIVTTSPPERIRLGTAGTPLPGVRLRLGDDGEVLIAGPTVTPGYFRDPARTAEVLDADGWFHTGDIGELDDDGYVRIVDRKKALIINSNGKNMSPANIEQAIKGGQALLAHVFAYGDRRSYNVALVLVDRDGLAAFLRSLNPPVDPAESSFAELTQRSDVLEAVAGVVQAGNERLSRVEQIKRFLVLDHDWIPGGEELTPTNKLKRREIAARYGAEIDALYA